jgi:hypothetical protein
MQRFSDILNTPSIIHSSSYIQYRLSFTFQTMFHEFFAPQAVMVLGFNGIDKT